MAHDVACGATSYGPVQRNVDDEVEWILAQGLGKLQTILDAPTYEERYRVINPLIWNNLFFGNAWLNKALHQPLRWDNGHLLFAMTEQDWDMYVRSPFFKEPDSMAWNSWKVLHDQFSADHFVNSRWHLKVRSAGYVFWDWKRVDMHFFKILMAESQFRKLTAREIQQREEAQESRKRRALIFARGGRGYWSFDDDTKVLFPNSTALTKVV